MNKNILVKIDEKNEEFIENNLNRILLDVTLGTKDDSLIEIFSVLSDYLLYSSLDEKNVKLVSSVSNSLYNEINNNENISKLFKQVGSANLNGAILIEIGLSLMNLDRFADQVINESIDKGDFVAKDLDLLRKLNVSNIKKTTLDRVNHYLVTGERNVTPKKTETTKNTCTNCNCSSRNASELSKDPFLNLLIEKIINNEEINEGESKIKYVSLLDILNNMMN